MVVYRKKYRWATVSLGHSDSLVDNLSPPLGLITRHEVDVAERNAETASIALLDESNPHGNDIHP